MSQPGATPSTAAIADAALRLGIAVRPGPVRLRPALPGLVFSGPARPVTHLGSVDVILETIDSAPRGSVLVVDNGGRTDEACVGDLLVLEASLAGLAGAVIWGLHRDTAQLREIGLPLHSVGAFPFGPRRVPVGGRAMSVAVIDGLPVTADDYVAGDDDGVLLFAGQAKDELFEAAWRIQHTEVAQAERMRSGESLRQQLDFDGYKRRQATDPDYSLRQHLIERGNSIET
ncbi:MAG TPA: RraA family protein [Microbacteriaceae bacterium]|jgi:Demethylmenaquinone methyltransferase